MDTDVKAGDLPRAEWQARLIAALEAAERRQAELDAEADREERASFEAQFRAELATLGVPAPAVVWWEGERPAASVDGVLFVGTRSRGRVRARIVGTCPVCHEATEGEAIVSVPDLARALRAWEPARDHAHVDDPADGTAVAGAKRPLPPPYFTPVEARLLDALREVVEEWR